MSPASVITLPTLNTSSAGALLPPAGGQRFLLSRAMRPTWSGSLHTRLQHGKLGEHRVQRSRRAASLHGFEAARPRRQQHWQDFRPERHVEPAKSAEMFVEALRRREEQKQQSDVLPSQPVSTDEVDAHTQPHQHIVRGGGGSRKHLKCAEARAQEAKRRSSRRRRWPATKHRPATVNPLSPILHARLTAAAAVLCGGDPCR